MLRSRAGEAVALTHLRDAMKELVLPIVHLTPFPPTTFAAAVGAAWCGRRMALDGKFQTDMLGRTAGFEQMFSGIGSHNVALIPSIDCHGAPPYLAAARRMCGRYAHGVLVKVRLGQLHDVATWCAAQGWATSDTDLVVNLGDIGGYEAGSLASGVVKALVEHVPNPSPWRSLTLAASAAPRDDSGLQQGRNIVPRTDWKVWCAVAKAIPRKLDYADFLTAHPDISEPPGFAAAKGLVSVRYTVFDEWIILRGDPMGAAGSHSMTRQYVAHAAALVLDPKFGGLNGCWADDRIREIARGTPRGGSRSVWTTIVASRHLALVAEQLCAQPLDDAPGAAPSFAATATASGQ